MDYDEEQALRDLVYEVLRSKYEAGDITKKQFDAVDTPWGIRTAGQSDLLKPRDEVIALVKKLQKEQRISFQQMLMNYKDAFLQTERGQQRLAEYEAGVEKEKARMEEERQAKYRKENPVLSAITDFGNQVAKPIIETALDLPILPPGVSTAAKLGLQGIESAIRGEPLI